MSDPKPKRKLVREEHEGFSITTRLDCHNRPLEAVVAFSSTKVDESFVGVFGPLEEAKKPFPGFCILDVPYYYRLGFALGKDEIYVTFRQQNATKAREELVQRLRVIAAKT